MKDYSMLLPRLAKRFILVVVLRLLSKDWMVA